MQYVTAPKYCKEKVELSFFLMERKITTSFLVVSVRVFAIYAAKETRGVM